MRRHDVPAGGIDAHRLGPARDPDRARPERDAGRARIARSPLIGTENRFAIRPVVASRRTSPGPSSSVTQAAPAARRDAARREGELRRREHLVRGEVDARDAALVAEQHPRLARVERDVPRLAGEAGSLPTTLWVVASMRPIVFGAIASRGGARVPPPSPVRTDAGRRGRGHDDGRRQRAECDPAAPPAAVRQLAAQGGLARSGELAAARVAVVRRLRERRGDDVVEARGNTRPHVAGARRRLVHVRVDRRDLALALERSLAGEALEEQAAERVDVRPPVDRRALDLLGRDVRDRADEGPLPGEALDRGEVPGETEVAEIGVLARFRPLHEDVAGLDVAVDEAESVGRVEGARDLSDEIDGAIGTQRALALEDLAQVEPVHEAHDEVEHPVLLAGCERRDDVRLLERGGDPRFAQEPLAEALVPRELGDQDLERDLLSLRVLGEIHGPGRAAPDQPRDAIPGDDASGREDVRHRRRSVTRAHRSPGASECPGRTRIPVRGGILTAR